MEQIATMQNDWGFVSSLPHTRARTSARASARCALWSVELVEGAKDRRVRRDRAEQCLLDSQVLDVRAALAAPREYEGHLDEYLAPVVEGQVLTARNDAR